MPECRDNRQPLERFAALRRRYEGEGRVHRVRQEHLARGTYTIREPGLYLVQEDLVFQPESDATYPPAALRAQQRELSLGWLSAIHVAADGVILDLQGHSLQQGCGHYLQQRFFALVRLSSHLFAAGVGPGPLPVPYVSYASNSMVCNGTLGLTSHFGIYGNEVHNTVLYKLRIIDFEVAGIQLNGPKNLLIDSCTAHALDYLPFSPLASTAILHANDLCGDDGSGDVLDLELNEDDCSGTLISTRDAEKMAVLKIQDHWLHLCASLHREHTKTGVTLRRVLTRLETDIRSTSLWTHWVHTIRNHNLNYALDCSAIYGIQIHSTKPSIGDIKHLCCPDTAGKPFHNVCIQNVVIGGMHLRARNNVLCQDSSGKWVTDCTGAKVDCVHEGQMLALRSVAEVCPCPHRKKNVDIMAHVHKGLMGMRIENGSAVTLNNIAIENLLNESESPLYPGVENANSHNPMDTAMRVHFGGTAIRAVLLALVTDVCVNGVRIESLHSDHGPVTGVELVTADRVRVDGIEMRGFTGHRVVGCQLQSSCGAVSVGDLQLKGARAAAAAPDPLVFAVEAGDCAVLRQASSAADGCAQGGRDPEPGRGEESGGCEHRHR